MIPDKLDDIDAKPGRFDVFGATLAVFFLAEKEIYPWRDWKDWTFYRTYA